MDEALGFITSSAKEKTNFVFEIVSCNVAQADLELPTILEVSSPYRVLGL
jgi:hypothetical protein